MDAWFIFDEDLKLILSIKPSKSWVQLPTFAHVLHCCVQLRTGRFTKWCPWCPHIQKHKNYQNLASLFWQIINNNFNLSVCLWSTQTFWNLWNERNDNVSYDLSSIGRQIRFIIITRWQKPILLRYLTAQRSDEGIFCKFFTNKLDLVEFWVPENSSMCGGFLVCWSLKPVNQLLSSSYKMCDKIATSESTKGNVEFIMEPMWTLMSDWLTLADWHLVQRLVYLKKKRGSVHLVAAAWSCTFVARRTLF